MKIYLYATLSACLVSVLILSACATPDAPARPPQYYSPLKNAQYVSKGATIIVRYGPVLSNQNLADLKFIVRGSASGLHSGQTLLADDHKTVIFKPDQPFTPGEQVSVNLNSLSLDGPANYSPLSFSFTVAVNQQNGSPASSLSGLPPYPPRSAFPDFLTLPHDIPHYTINTAGSGVAEGDIFVAPFYWTKSKTGSYLLILNGQGQIVYYQSVADDLAAFDFKVQPNGLISYFSQKDSTFYLMDSHYRVVDSYQAGDGYAADLHDLQILPDGNALIMSYDSETVDMSKVVPNGKTNATVTGLIIQELDPSKNVIFEWRSWDHFAFDESTSSLTDQNIDLVHGNALALTNDGNLLLSSRNQSEITKINLQTGDVIWRLGGKANMFKFVNSQPFAYQHDVRQLPNGDITVFDNQGTLQNPAASEGIEYQIDEIKKTATAVWDFLHIPPVFATFMGNTQRLSNGNTFLSWGAPATTNGYSFVTMTEVSPENNTLFEFTFDQPYVSYRAFVYPWHATPDSLPDLDYRANADGLTLGYSWNGATDVASYQVYGGSSTQSLNLIDQPLKKDFETQTYLAYPPQNECYFQVAALDSSGHELARSKIISTDSLDCPPVP